MRGEAVAERSLIRCEVEGAYQNEVDPSALRQAASACLEHLEEDDSALSVILIGDQRMQELNLRYRGVDRPTDVLAFSVDFQDPDLEARYLGDVLISVPRARAQAADRNHDLQAELQLLVVHGTLHLLGFDHLEEDEKKDMFSRQAEILEQMGVEVDIKA